MSPARMSGSERFAPSARRLHEGVTRVVVVDGSPDVLRTLETVLEAGEYAIDFIESADHAYSRIRRGRPDVVVLCTHPSDAQAFRLVAMLNLDEETRGIRVISCPSAADELAPGEGLSPLGDDVGWLATPPLSRRH